MTFDTHIPAPTTYKRWDFADATPGCSLWHATLADAKTFQNAALTYSANHAKGWGTARAEYVEKGRNGWRVWITEKPKGTANAKKGKRPAREKLSRAAAMGKGEDWRQVDVVTSDPVMARFRAKPPAPTNTAPYADDLSINPAEVSGEGRRSRTFTPPQPKMPKLD